ncbi:MAG TPA: hypothetical protein VJU87_00465 [Gemmatimonadaceae bacterium]|nr:hypothetical protein [Gemmatimonadaceae bacterium]
MRSMRLAATLVTLASPLMAQTKQQAKEMDPTHKVAGGISAPGWMGRVDDKDARRAMTINDVKFVVMGTGYHVTAGPAAIYWNPKDVARGNYTVQATFTQTRAPMHPEAYGLFVGGAHLQDSTQSYLYFLTRGDGKYLINHRAGSAVHKIVEWTASGALHPQDAAGKATNELAIRVTTDSVQFLANGTPVKAFSRAEMHGMLPDGQAGLRVNHNLDVHVGGFAVTSR